jgi:hypothetical protein
MDWSTPDDFDKEGADWVETSVVGSPYQVEADINSATWRHRERRLGSSWQEGLPPKDDADTSRQA